MVIQSKYNCKLGQLALCERSLNGKTSGQVHPAISCNELHTIKHQYNTNNAEQPKLYMIILYDDVTRSHIEHIVRPRLHKRSYKFFYLVKPLNNHSCSPMAIFKLQLENNQWRTATQKFPCARRVYARREKNQDLKRCRSRTHQGYSTGAPTVEYIGNQL